MSRVLTTCLAIILVIVVAFLSPGFAQDNNDQPTLSQQDMENYMNQAEQLVRFMEFTFNTLGNPEVNAREKDIIINQSYLKFFVSNKVQIEDDLVEGRFTVTNKDVQAYLKDIDFFFTKVSFTFTIEDVSYSVNENGQFFFVVTTTRNLSGTSVEGDTLFNNQQRFIEINLDRNERDLKIASIYTTRLSEREDMRNWWSGLSADWRLFFSKGTIISGQYPLKDILNFDKDWILVERFQVTVVDGYVLESRRADTVFADPAEIYPEIGKFWKTENIDLTAFPFIFNLDPLSKLTELRTINISGTYVEDLTPVRNLTRLESLNISGSQVSSLDPLRYSINLKNLDASNTSLTDSEPLRNFPSLERLNLSGTQLNDFEPLSGLSTLRDLRLISSRLANLEPIGRISNLVVLDISNTYVTRLEPISKLQSLERLHADNTGITDLSPLASLTALQYLFIEGTGISDIQSLSGMSSLTRIYCDRTNITREKANGFMQDNPDVLVIYESLALSAWWARLPDGWTEVFQKLMTLSNPPTREELHELANTTHINISGNKEIFSLSPLQQLKSLQSLRAAETNIISIDPLKDNIDLIELDISSTRIQDISALSSLRLLESLKLTNTLVDNISALRTNQQLKYLDLDQTFVASLAPLAALSNLEVVICDSAAFEADAITEIYDANPKVTVIYQTKVLQNWWVNLPQTWVDIFISLSGPDNPPDRFQLQRLVDLKELDISKVRGISDLAPLQHFHRLEVLKMIDLQINDLATLAELPRLRELYCSENPINSLEPLKNLIHLTVLDCSNTLVRNLNEIGNLPNLRVLNIAGTQVRSLGPLRNMHSLRQLDCYNTRIRNLAPLENLVNLELLRCYNTPLWPWTLNRFKNAVPDCEVIYY